ncbi:arylformamidase [Thermoplasmatales archaeon]|nr:arylformamidase [Thermoplasmatales archaeon]
MKYKWFDLSHTYEEGMPEATGHAAMKSESVNNRNTGSRITNITFNSHCGTHIDAPYHYVDNGRTIDTFPPDFFSGTAAVLDLPRDDFQPVTRDDILKNLDLVSAADFVFIRTGWEEKWNREEYVWKYPYISPEAAEYLASSRIRILGTDTISPDPSLKSGLRKGSPAHLALLPRNILIIENLAGLKPLAGKLVETFCFPLKFTGGDGSPVRVVARIPT